MPRPSSFPVTSPRVPTLIIGGTSADVRPNRHAVASSGHPNTSRHPGARPRHLAARPRHGAGHLVSVDPQLTYEVASFVLKWLPRRSDLEALADERSPLRR